MSDQVIGIVLGGLVPAVLLGVFAVLQKLSGTLGAGPGTYLVFVGFGVLTVAGILMLAGYREPFSLKAMGASFVTGLVWAAAVTFIVIAQVQFGASVARLAPLFNMNTLVAVLLGFVVFAEWQGVRVPRLSLGAVLIVLGGTLVATA